jgi:hypothetical protein
MFLSSGTLYVLQAQQRHGYAAAAEQAVTKLEQEWFADQLALNWPKLKSMIAEDFVLTESDGKLGTRDTMLEGYKTESSLTSNIKMTFLVTHAVSADTVIAIGRRHYAEGQRRAHQPSLRTFYRYLDPARWPLAVRG